MSGFTKFGLVGILFFAGLWLGNSWSQPDAQLTPVATPTPVRTVDHRAEFDRLAEEKQLRQGLRERNKKYGFRLNGRGEVGIEDEFDLIERDVRMEHGVSFDDAWHEEDE